MTHTGGACSGGRAAMVVFFSASPSGRSDLGWRKRSRSASATRPLRPPKLLLKGDAGWRRRGNLDPTTGPAPSPPGRGSRGGFSGGASTHRPPAQPLGSGAARPSALRAHRLRSQPGVAPHAAAPRPPQPPPPERRPATTPPPGAGCPPHTPRPPGRPARLPHQPLCSSGVITERRERRKDKEKKE